VAHDCSIRLATDTTHGYSIRVPEDAPHDYQPDCLRMLRMTTLASKALQRLFPIFFRALIKY
jgi:hypothetical protein